MVSALTGFRIVELAEGVAGEYCGKLLADFGAEVIKIERPGWGSPTRAVGSRVARPGTDIGDHLPPEARAALDERTAGMTKR